MFTLPLALAAVAAAQAPAKQAARPAPTAADVAYGPHERNKLDFWKAKGDAPAPLVVYIHGGGWVNGDKGTYRPAKAYFDAGFAVAAINYRLIKEGKVEGVEPPVKAPLEDAALAVQFLRSKAKDWNIDPKRVGATGGSAGACSSLWLAFHDDLADPKSADPVKRESTRLQAAAVSGAQTTLDPKPTREWVPNARYGGHAFGIVSGPNRDGAFGRFLEEREKLLPLIREYSPLTHVTADDPAVFLEYGAQKTPPVKGTAQADPTHSPLLGMMLKEKCDEMKVECVLVYPGKADDKYKTSADFLVERLKK